MHDLQPVDYVCTFLQVKTTHEISVGGTRVDMACSMCAYCELLGFMIWMHFYGVFFCANGHLFSF